MGRSTSILLVLVLSLAFFSGFRKMRMEKILEMMGIFEEYSVEMTADARAKSGAELVKQVARSTSKLNTLSADYDDLDEISPTSGDSVDTFGTGGDESSSNPDATPATISRVTNQFNLRHPFHRVELRSTDDGYIVEARIAAVKIPEAGWFTDLVSTFMPVATIDSVGVVEFASLGHSNKALLDFVTNNLAGARTRISVSHEISESYEIGKELLVVQLRIPNP